MSKKQAFTEADLDAILASVDEFVADAKKLAKSEDALKKDDAPPAPQEEEAPVEEAPVEDAPAPETAAPEMDAAPSEEPPMEDAPMGDIPADESPELSDEELIEIYGSMPPEELERHYMIMRHIMASMEAPSDEAPAMPEEEAGPAMDEAPPMDDGMGKSEPEAEEKKDEKDEEKKEEMEKSEAKIKDLEAQLATQSETVTKLVKALELFSAPQRKSVQGLQQLGKSEAVAKQNLSRDEMIEEIKRVQKEKAQSLTKSDRESINDFVKYGTSREAVLKLIQ